MNTELPPRERAVADAARMQYRRGMRRGMAVGAVAASNGVYSGGRRPGSGGSPVSMVPTNRAFPAADRNRVRATLTPYSGLADNFLTGYTQRKLREECRQAKRRFTLAKSMVNRMADLMIADGLILKLTTADEEYNKAAKLLLENWCNAPTLKGRGRSMTQALRSVSNEWDCAGDIAWVYTKDGLIQEIEADRIVNPGGWAMTDTSTCVGGVEIDESGKPVAFHVQSRADALAGLAGTNGVVRIPAADVYFSVNPVDQEVGQTRGLPSLASAVPLIELLETYVEDMARAAKMATFLGYIFKTEDGSNPLSELEGDVDNPAAGTPAHNLELQTGYSLTLGANESVEQLHPEYPTAYARDFASMVGMQCTASGGLPLILVLLDPSQTNFHGFKSAIAVCFRQIAYKQAAIIDMFKWACERRLADAIRAGELKFVEDWNAMHVIAPSLPTPDFGADVDAHIKAVQANLETADTATQQLGTGDAADIRRVRALEVADEKSKQITPVVAGAAVVQKGIPK